MKTGIISTLVISSLFLSACGTAFSLPEQEHPEVPEEAVSETAKEQADDFKTGETVTAEFGGYSVEVPEKWPANHPYYYPEMSSEENPDAVAMLYMYETEDDFSAEDLDYEKNAKAVLKGFSNSIDNFSLSSLERITVNDIPMWGAVCTGSIKDVSMTFLIFIFHDSITNKLAFITFSQSDASKYDHTQDLGKILKSLKQIAPEEDAVAADDTASVTPTEESVATPEPSASPEVVETPTPEPTPEATAEPEPTPAPVYTPTTAKEETYKPESGTTTGGTTGTLTVTNNEDLKNLLDTNIIGSQAAADFVSKYKGRKIQIDCYVYSGDNYPDNNQRFNYYFQAGDSQANGHGPIFEYEFITYYDFNFNRKDRPSSIDIGDKLTITAKVVGESSDRLYILLEPVSTRTR